MENEQSGENEESINMEAMDEYVQHSAPTQAYPAPYPVHEVNLDQEIEFLSSYPNQEAEISVQYLNQEQETPSPYLDSEIWSNIPDHLLEQVLLRLPLPSLLRFRSVKKSWQLLISSSDFLEHYSVISKQSPWFLMFTNHEYKDGSVYDPISRSWFHIPLPNLPLTERYIPVAAAGGLICFCASTAGQKKFIVCNLLTRSWRRLPPMLNNPSYLETVGMIVDQQAKLYTVVVAGNRELSVDDIITEVYESAGDYWRMSNPMPRGADPLLGTIFCDGMLYSWCCDPDGLVAYDILTHTWRLIHIPAPEGLVSNTIMECKGRILLVGGLQEGNVTKTICVWELQKEKHEWIEIDRMPQFLCQDFLDDRMYFMCVGTSDILLLYIGGGLKEMPILQYNLGSKVWQRVPSCSLSDDRIVDGLVDGISFEPRLDVLV